jgi:hypothetical protein
LYVAKSDLGRRLAQSLPYALGNTPDQTIGSLFENVEQLHDPASVDRVEFDQALTGSADLSTVAPPSG